MNSKRTRAVVLKRTNYGEADRIIQFLTENGRQATLARGVRKEKSKLAGGIELFAVCDVVLARGKGELNILTSARLIQFYRNILHDYDRMQFAYEVLRLVRKASEYADDSEWFSVAVTTLAGLDATKLDIRLTKVWFYLHYSEILGYELSLRYDATGQPLSSNNNYRYDTNEKALKSHKNGQLSEGHITLLRLAASKPLKNLAVIGGLETVLDECLYVARQHASIEETTPW